MGFSEINEYGIVKHPNWQEAGVLAINKRGQYREQYHLVVRTADYGFQIQCPNNLATLPSSSRTVHL